MSMPVAGKRGASLIQDKRQAGFTLVELLLATTYFSFVLLFISSGFIQINRVYQSIVVTKNAQNTARAIFEQIGHDMKAGDTLAVYNPGGDGSYCLGIGSIYYRFDNTAHTLRRSLVGCDAATDPGVLVHENNLRVYGFDFDPVKTSSSAGTPRSAALHIVIGVANAAFVDTAAERCQTADPSILHICSVVSMDTAVSLRGEEI
jgi:hypothetical protein